MQLADILLALDRNAESEVLLREVVAQRKKFFGEDHPSVPRAMRSLALSQIVQGGAKAAEAQLTLSAAEAAFRKLLAKQRASASTDPLEIATTLEGLGSTLFRRPGRMPEVEALRREQLTILRTSLGEENRQVAGTLRQLSRALSEQGKFAEAERVIREAVALEEKLHGATTPTLISMLTQLGSVLGQLGRLAEAEEFLRETAAEYRKSRGNENRALATTLEQLGFVLGEQDKLAEAEPFLKEALAIREKLASDDWETFNARSLLGANLMRQERYDAAERLLLSGYEGMKVQADWIVAVGKPPLRNALQRLAQLYEATGKAAQAAEWKQELAEFEKANHGINEASGP
jgi:serine/threonine-protein kinase